MFVVFYLYNRALYQEKSRAVYFPSFRKYWNRHFYVISAIKGRCLSMCFCFLFFVSFFWLSVYDVCFVCLDLKSDMNYRRTLIRSHKLQFSSNESTRRSRLQFASELNCCFTARAGARSTLSAVMYIGVSSAAWAQRWLASSLSLPVSDSCGETEENLLSHLCG